MIRFLSERPVRGHSLRPPFVFEVARRGNTTVSKASSSTTPISTIPTIAQSNISVLLILVVF